MVESAWDLLRFYKKYAINWWDHIGPTEYLVLLLMVGFLGYLLMLRTSGNKIS